MTLRHRVRAAERSAARRGGLEHRVGVCDRIDELAAAFLTDPPTFAPAVEVGILTAVERQICFGEQLPGTPAEDRL